MSVKLEASALDRNVRSNLADDLEKYWVGHTTSNIGLQYLKLEDGIVVAGGYFERTDIFCFQDFTRGVNVFVEADGSTSIQPWESGGRGRKKATPLTPEEIKSIHRQVKAALKAQAEYVAFEAKFLRERPWTDVYGMTPEDAVASLRAWAENAKTDTTPIATVTVTAPDGTELTSFPIYTNEVHRDAALAFIGQRVSDAVPAR